MKTCDEMVNSLIKRRDEFLAEQKQKRRTAAKIYTAGGSCAVAAAIGVGVFNSGILREKKAIVPDDFSAISDNSSSINDEPVKDDPVKEPPSAPDFSSVIWAEEGKGGIPSGDVGAYVEQDFMRLYWNGKEIYRSLYNAFEEHGDDTVFAIAARCYPYDENFVYNGKTLARYNDEEMEIWDKEIRRIQLIKVGDSLKYGEALITTGTPDGERWDEELYYRTVSEIGEEILSEYIVDGEFLKDKLERDISDLDNERMALLQSYKQGRDACRKNMFETAAEQITAQGIYLETMYDLGSPYSLIIFATKDEFAALTFDGMQKWYFALAEKCSDGDSYVAGEFIDCY
ncbi:MAG: hypothetical protein J1F03_10525 [Oscillospiraceae bacterium]|nr:hypothetical protein [Oscillospiraceae bacterium]